jgi:hypothetical protein
MLPFSLHVLSSQRHILLFLGKGKFKNVSAYALKSMGGEEVQLKSVLTWGLDEFE